MPKLARLHMHTCITTSMRLQLLRSSGWQDQALTAQYGASRGGEEAQAGNAAVQPPHQHGLLPQQSDAWLQGLLLAKNFNRNCCFSSTGRKVCF